MSQLTQILEEKGRKVHAIDAEESVFEAVQRMVEENIGSLLVTDGGTIAGIVTERDYLRRVTLEGRTDRDTAVREIMSKPLIAVSPEMTVDECMALMTDRRVRHLPVVDEGTVIGLVSIGDLVKFTASRRASEIRLLTDYIATG
jgi:CBS domain-containing protein